MRVAFLSSLGLLTACAGAANAPSLAVRPIEAKADAINAEPAPVVTRPIDAAVSGQIAALLGDATAADADFTNADTGGSAQIAAGRGAKPGSERWIAAQQAQSALVAAQQRTADVRSKLDALVLAQAQTQAADPAAGGQMELQSALAVVEAMATRQTTRLADLQR